MAGNALFDPGTNCRTFPNHLPSHVQPLSTSPGIRHQVPGNTPDHAALDALMIGATTTTSPAATTTSPAATATSATNAAASPAAASATNAVVGESATAECAAVGGESALSGGLTLAQISVDLGYMGSDRIMARRMREDFWHFDPTHKLILSTNHKPRIIGTDFGVWRRLRLVPFIEKISEAEKDLGLKEKLREHEAPGILAWLVESAMMYQRDGLTPPDAVMLATNEYRESEDTLGQFLADCVAEADSDFISATDLHAAFVVWCNTNGIPERQQIGQRTLTSKLKDRGFAYVNKPCRGFKNLRLVAESRDVPNVQTGMNANLNSTRGAKPETDVPNVSKFAPRITMTNGAQSPDKEPSNPEPAETKSDEPDSGTDSGEWGEM